VTIFTRSIAGGTGQPKRPPVDSADWAKRIVSLVTPVEDFPLSSLKPHAARLASTSQSCRRLMLWSRTKPFQMIPENVRNVAII